MTYAKLLMPSLLTVAVICSGLASIAEAQPRRTPFGAQRTQPETQVSIGVGGAVVPEYEGSEDYELVPVPFLRIGWGAQYLQLQANTLEANLVADPNWQAGPLVRFRRNAFAGDVDNDRVDDLKGDGDAVEVGGFIATRIDNWDARLQVVKDVNAGHKGWVTTVQGGYTMALNPTLNLRLGAETTYGSGNYMSSYFGIDLDNAIRSGLDEYDADESFRDVGISASLSYRPNAIWAVVGTFAYQRLVGDAEDSPVVDDEGSENQFLGSVLAIYNF